MNLVLRSWPLRRMKKMGGFLALLAICHVALGDPPIPSSLDPALSEAREKAFTPWCTPEQDAANWQKFAGTHVPVYNERKAGGLSRNIYIPNPGVGYWVLGNLTEAQLLAVHTQKLKIGDELVSVSAYQNEEGKTVYWALWTARSRAYLLLEKMRELGIGLPKVKRPPEATPSPTPTPAG